MAVKVRMRLARRIAGRVLVLVVSIVRVHVLVLDRAVLMHVGMPFSQEQGHARCHAEHGSEIEPAESLVEDERRGERTYEGRGREVRGLTRGADEPKRIRVQDNRQAVAENAQEQGGGRDAWVRECATEADPEQEVEAARDKRFDADDRERITERKPLREIVVDRPSDTCPGHRRHSPRVDRDRLRLQFRVAHRQAE